MKIKFAVLVEIEVEDMSTGEPPCESWHGYTPSRRHVTDYVRDAVSSWGGQFHPTDPFFPKNITVKVR